MVCVSIFEVGMRNCKKCVYAKWMSNKVYCMFFNAPSCPKGTGDLYLGTIKQYPSVAKKTDDFKPPYPRPTGKSSLIKHHEDIFRMRYLENYTLKEMASVLGVSYPAITQYMENCESAEIASGNTEWIEWKRKQTKKITCFALGITPDGEIPPPPPLPARCKTRYENHPLRQNHEEIFKMLRAGYKKREIAEKLDLNTNSLYAYIQKCEDAWSD